MQNRLICLRSYEAIRMWFLNTGSNFLWLQNDVHCVRVPFSVVSSSFTTFYQCKLWCTRYLLLYNRRGQVDNKWESVKRNKISSSTPGLWLGLLCKCETSKGANSMWHFNYILLYLRALWKFCLLPRNGSWEHFPLQQAAGAPVPRATTERSRLHLSHIWERRCQQLLGGTPA